MPESSVSTLYIKNLNERIPRQTLHQELSCLCEKYGTVVSLTISKGLKKRGQAFVAFNTAEQALNARNDLNGMSLFHKQIEIYLARSNYKAPKSPGTENAPVMLSKISSNHTPRDAKTKSPRPPPTTNTSVPSTAAKSLGEPHNLLLLQQIPDAVTVDSLKKVCAEFAGFKEARMFAVRHVGFVEFESVDSAAEAINQMSKLGIGTVTYAKK